METKPAALVQQGEARAPSPVLNVSPGTTSTHIGPAASAGLTVQATLNIPPNTNNMANVIKTLKLNDFQNRIAGELSAGQKRRLGLARMLITNAKIWLMDEPTVSLDKTTTTLISEIITQHCKEGGAAIISTHVNLNLPSSKVLDISEFKPEIDEEFDPFLEGVF